MNSPLEYSTRISRPTRPAPLRSIDNSTNVMCNTSICHFNTTSEIIPSSFNEMTIYQLCSWLCANPNVLQMANNVQKSMQMSVVDGSQFVPFIPSISSTTLQNQENRTKACRDFLEELKCLFLHVRNPPKSVFEELVCEIFKCELNSMEGIEWLQTAIRDFGDFRNKLLNGVEDLINEFKEKRTLTSPLQREEIISFVDENVTAHVLKRWLAAVNMVEFGLKIQCFIYVNLFGMLLLLTIHQEILKGQKPWIE